MKWWMHLILGALMFTPLSPLILAFYILYYGVKFITWYIKLLLHVFALIVIIPLWIMPYLFPYVIIRYVLLKAGINIGKFSFTWAEKIASNFKGALHVIENKSKRTAEFTVFWGLILFIFFPIEPSLSYLTNNIRSILVITAFIVGPIFLGASIYHKVKGTSREDLRRAGRAAGQTVPGAVEEQTARTMHHIEGGAKGANQEYDKFKQGVEKGEKSYELVNILFPNLLQEVLLSLENLMPFMGTGGGNVASKTAGKSAGAASKAEKGAKAARAGAAAAKVVSLPRILVALLVGFPIAILLIVFTSGIISGFFWAYMEIWLGTIVGPMWSALGLAWMVGGDYVHFADQTIVSEYAPAIDFEDEKLVLSEVAARADCLLAVDSVDCMSEWRMENTVQPGSEEVGQTYELQTRQFLVEGGRTVDVSGRRADLPLTVRMALSNPRYGLRGVPAEDISYKIGITNNNRDGYYCDTGNHELWDHSRNSDRTNDLAPGDQYQLTSVQRNKDFYQDNINLGSCGLLQPGQIEDIRQAELQINYTYTSQATQSFRAMSEEHRFDNEIRQSFKTSETADTPVKSFVTVMSPVTYREDEQEGQPVSNVIDVEVGFETNDPGIEYQIHTDELYLRPSRLTKPTGAESENNEPIESWNDIDHIDGACDFEMADEDEYLLKLNENATESVKEQQDTGRQWTARSSPPTFQCSFELINPESISSTGETLIKDVEGSYRVTQEFQSQNFDVWNTECTDRNCPLIVPEDQRQEISDENIREGLVSSCDRSHSAEASGGCDVRPVPTESSGEFDNTGWRVISQDYHVDVPAGETIEHQVISEGETAYTFGHIINQLEKNSGNHTEICSDPNLDQYSECSEIGGTDTDNIPEEWEAVGLEGSELEDAKDTLASVGTSFAGSAAITRRGSSIGIHDFDIRFCSGFENPDGYDVEYDTEEIEERIISQEARTPLLLYYKMTREDCDVPGEDWWEDWTPSWMWDADDEEIGCPDDELLVQDRGGNHLCY